MTPHCKLAINQLEWPFRLLEVSILVLNPCRLGNQAHPAVFNNSEIFQQSSSCTMEKTQFILLNDRGQ